MNLTLNFALILVLLSHDASIRIREKNDLRNFNEKIREYEKEGKIPALETKAEYTIYRWKAGFMQHESIVLGCNGKFFSLEIRVDEKIHLWTTVDGIKSESLKECGKVKATGLTLVRIACKIFKDMSPYNLVFNNCQDFVNSYLEKVKMSNKVNDTDATKIIKAGGAAATAGAAAAAIGISGLSGSTIR